MRPPGILPAAHTAVWRGLMKSNLGRRVSIILLIFLGLSILLYPAVSDAWNRYRAHLLISDYSGAVQAMDNDEYEEELARAQEYNETLIGGVVPDAFAVREGIFDEEYESLLSVTDDLMMGHVEIPAIDVDLPIYHYTYPDILQKGAGHLFGSSLPVGGESTHAVITAHRGLPSAKLFTDLNLLKEGDQFYLYVYDDILAYEVDLIQTVEPDETSSLSITPGEDYVTLITCTPYGVNSHRLLVRGHRVPYTEVQAKRSVTENLVQRGPRFIIELLCLLAGVVVAGLLIRVYDRVKRRRGD